VEMNPCKVLAVLEVNKLQNKIKRSIHMWIILDNRNL
jgi:hypothetical protein